MIRQISVKILVILSFCFLAYPKVSHAGWGRIGACLDPRTLCSCGCNQVTRTWGTGAGSVNERKRLDCLCPPYNKRPRGRGGCLNQFNIPHGGQLNYMKFCAEDSGALDSFNPRIGVRYQVSVLGAACVAFRDTIEGDGECKVYPGVFGLPTLRICARAAFAKYEEEILGPGGSASGTTGRVMSSVDNFMGMNRQSSFGYTYGWHLDHEGFPQRDDIYIDDEGNEVVLNFPKVCAYWDPSFTDAFGGVLGFFLNGIESMVNGIQGGARRARVPDSHIRKFEDAAGLSPRESRARSQLRIAEAYFRPDTWDINPVFQPTHYAEGGTHFLFRLIIQMHQMRMQLEQMKAQLIKMALEKVDTPDIMIKGISGFLDFMHIVGPSNLIPVMEYMGQVNAVVAASIGCVKVPPGPMPPPYCDTLTPTPPVPVLHRICPTEMDGTSVVTRDPTTVNNCVQSVASNNFINNAVRVGFNSIYSLCTPSQDVTEGGCVRIPNHSVSARNMATITSNTHLLNVCSTIPAPTTEQPCVESQVMIDKCAADSRHCSRQVRVVYTDGQGSSTRPYYYSDIADCASSVGAATCQKIAGVNIGEFADIALNFPSTESSNNTSPLTASATIQDSAGTDVPVTAKIFRENTTHSSGIDMTSASIYAFDSGDNMLGDVARAKAPLPQVFGCGAPGTSVSCNTSHIKPALIAKIAIGTNSTEGAISLPSEYAAPAGSVTNETLNLAGFQYNTFATDNNITIAPFSGPRSLNASTIHGLYEGGAAPYNSSGAATNANYLSGIEYINGEYVFGGTTLCLKDYDFESCATGSSRIHCVKTRLTNSSLVNCGDFQRRVISNSNYAGINLCNSAQRAAFSFVRNETFTSPSMTVGIYRQTAQGPYCYDYSSSGTNGPLCAPGLTRSLRDNPSSTITGALTSSQYYNFNPSSPPNSATFAVRDKTALEHGLCVAIPAPPSCAAVSDGNANWPSAGIGANSTGTCIAGYSPKASGALNRLCTRNDANGTARFVPISSTIGCSINCSVRTNSAGSSYNASTKTINLVQNPLNRGIYTYRLQFDIPNIASVRNLRLKNVGADDSYRVKVNGNHIISGPGGVYRPGHEYGVTSNSGDINTDLKSYLNAGTNEIEFTVSVEGFGNFYANIIFERTGCSNLNIQTIP